MNTLHLNAQAALLEAAPDQTLLLAPGQAARLPATLVSALAPRWWRTAPTEARALVLTLEVGALWLTWPGCEDDVYLMAGETLRLPTAPEALAGLLMEPEPRLASGPARLCLRWQGAPGIDSAPSCRTPTSSVPMRPLLGTLSTPR